MAKRQTSEKWEEILKEWEAGGDSQISFCRRNNISVSTFAYHLKKAKEKMKDSGFVKVPVRIRECERIKEQTVRIRTEYCEISIEGQEIEKTLAPVLRILQEVNR